MPEELLEPRTAPPLPRPSASPHSPHETLDRALRGDDESLRRLVDLLTPVIQTRVARVLLASHTQSPDVLRQEVGELVQEVFLHLFADGARILRSWKPDKGASLENFVGLVAARRCISILRGRESTRRRTRASLEEAEDVASSDPGGEVRAMGRDRLRTLLRRMREELSPLGWSLFQRFFLRGQTVEEVTRTTGLSPSASYAWRSRLRKRARVALEDQESAELSCQISSSHREDQDKDVES